LLGLVGWDFRVATRPRGGNFLQGATLGFWKHFPLAAFIGILIALQMAAVLMGGFRMVESPIGEVTTPVASSNTKELGILLYSEYVYPLQIAAVILLVGMIAAIALTLRARKDSKYVDPGEQVRVKSRDRMTVVKMSATLKSVDLPPAPPAEEPKK
jgi:NADH-quinone oxidoreductase subunit J